MDIYWASPFLFLFYWCVWPIFNKQQWLRLVNEHEWWTVQSKSDPKNLHAANFKCRKWNFSLWQTKFWAHINYSSTSSRVSLNQFNNWCNKPNEYSHCLHDLQVEKTKCSKKLFFPLFKSVPCSPQWGTFAGVQYSRSTAAAAAAAEHPFPLCKINAAGAGRTEVHTKNSCTSWYIVHSCFTGLRAVSQLFVSTDLKYKHSLLCQKEKKRPLLQHC